MAKGKHGYYRANQGFATTLDGEPLFVQKGELVRDGHPLLKGREDLFDPAENFGRFDVDAKDVEQATAAPGEKRGLRTKPDAKPKPAAAKPTPAPAEPKLEPRPEPKPSGHFGLQTKDIGEPQPDAVKKT